ncbi:MAG: hypothetical protein BWY63_00474 [Chloroflexi bacterium ADurb.Bin360]|nr:MAG: hypothetical protein BWY63_00474 [Chloroflexi bacterium ADurb.Bin360]
MSHKVRHILGLSGGKDSTALAIYLRDRIPDIEYFFCDTGKELPETYAYLNRVEAYLGRKIARLTNEGRDFDHYLIVRRGFLPSPQNRWCTELLKLKALEAYIGNDLAISYVGLRADEDREGYVSTKPNVCVAFPFQEDGIVLSDVLQILDSAGLGLPDYYKWRSRSGCFFCFFQRKIEWVGLLENHPDLFEQACKYEKPELGVGYTWCSNESLRELSQPDRVAQIKAEFIEQQQKEATMQSGHRLIDIIPEDKTLSSSVVMEVMKSWKS